MQNIINILNESGKYERSKYHLTLGNLIDFLKKNNDKPYPIFAEINETFCNLSDPHSYRGHYSDLALSSAKDRMNSNELLHTLENDILLKELTGYKGGDFLMDENTPIWISNYGNNSGIAAIGIEMTAKGIIIKTKMVKYL